MSEELENNITDDDATAAMMQEMAEDGSGDAAAAEDMGIDGDGALSQDEIDSLLGFGDEEEAVTKGVEALLSKTRDNYEKFPMLEVVFDRFSRSMSTTMRNFTGENSEINIENITSIRFEDYLNSIPLPAMISIFQAVEWENVGIMTIDSALVYSLIDILLGGGNGENVFRVEGRPFTVIEQDIIKNFSRIVFDELASAFTPISSVSFRMDRLETNPRFATITRPQTPVVIISFRVEFDSVGGKVDVVFPYTTLEPVKEQLMQMFAGESFGAEVSWESFLSDELKSTDIKLSAKLKSKKITLKELSELRVGSTLVTDNKVGDTVSVSCNGISIFNGTLGSSEDKVAVSIKDSFDVKDIL